MSSELYRRALAALSDVERAAFEGWLKWLNGHAGLSADRPAEGARVLANLQVEAHLVGGGAFGDPAELIGFLRRCIDRSARSAYPEERHRGYDTACQEFIGRGLQIFRDHLPDGLLRYSSSRTMASRLVERILGKRARDAFDRDILPLETAFARLRDRWMPFRLDVADRLGREDEVFATFEHPGGAPRDDAAALSRALALPLWQGPRTGLEMLIELAYPTDAVTDYRFPTVADAGWIHLFLPAAEEAPDMGNPSTCCGWTEPLGPYPPQPEIVHDNASLRVLSAPPRFVGSIA